MCVTVCVHMPYATIWSMGVGCLWQGELKNIFDIILIWCEHKKSVLTAVIIQEELNVLSRIFISNLCHNTNSGHNSPLMARACETIAGLTSICLQT